MKKIVSLTFSGPRPRLTQPASLAGPPAAPPWSGPGQMIACVMCMKNGRIQDDMFKALM